MFKFILVYDQNIAFGTVPAIFVDRCWMGWLNMNEQGHFANQCLPGTVGAGGKPDILIWIQDEPVFRGQISELWQRRSLLSHG